MHNLDRIKIIEKIDQGKMHQLIADFPEHCQKGYSLGQRFSLDASYAQAENIVFCGMGGSAIGAELLSVYLRSELKLATYINRDYTLPEFVNKNCLVIVSSYSGNTEETLSAYAQAQAKAAKIIVLTSGGQLAQLAGQDNHPCISIPQGFAPRAALAFLYFPLLAILVKLGLISDQEKQVQETVAVLTRLKQDSLGLDVPTADNPAKQLAVKLVNNLAAIYAAGEHLAAVVSRWRGQLAENSKALASSHLLPEMNHNEIVGWQYPHKLLTRIVAIFLTDKQDHPQVQKRISISKEILQKQGIQVEQIASYGESLLARTFSLIHIGDFVSLYLAVLNGEDPTPVKRIDYLKTRLRQ